MPIFLSEWEGVGRREKEETLLTCSARIPGSISAEGVCWAWIRENPYFTNEI
jgi:hypothetical protein